MEIRMNLAALAVSGLLPKASKPLPSAVMQRWSA
jgi:hypothetical protein